jgi:hypothetical protein
MRYLVATLLSCSLFISQAAPGDTTMVKAHELVDMTWYRSYRAWASFPDASHSYHKIIMQFDLGCASTGCSDWDYTTLINLLNPTGNFDSTVTRIDTLQNNPLVVDTIWNVFEVKERFELAKVITPYGGALANDWSRTFYFDVTDYYPMLKDSIEFEAFYQGWSSGFSVSLNFMLIEGTPPRDVLKVENLYRGQFNYITTSAFETNFMPARQVNLEPAAQQFYLRMAPSGHGFINALNCAEFCDKDYYVNVNGNRVAQQAMWRNDCGVNALWPQAGTWLYDRANWCPGDRVNIYDHDLTAHLSGSTASIDVDIEPYTYTVPSGETPANYNMSGQLFQMGDFNYQLDAELAAIGAPTNNDHYGRINPVCSEAMVVVANKGANLITSLVIDYGVSGNGARQQYTWQGNISSFEEVEIPLEMNDLSNWTTWRDTMVFTAQLVSVNGQADDLAYNNQLSSSFTPAPQLPGKMRFDLRTNNAASETHWQLMDMAAGTTIKQGDNLNNSTSYRDTFDLQPGCYQLAIFDRDKDGMSFFGNNDGGGSAGLRNIGGSFLNYTINPNFGTHFKLNFTVGYGIGLPDVATLQNQPDVFPNPSNGQVNIVWQGAEPAVISYELLSLSGQTLQNGKLGKTKTLDTALDLSHLAQGVYLLKMTIGQQSFQEKIRLL